MQVNLQWFEGQCQELSRNPAAATKKIEQFRESDIALDACKSFLQSNQLSQVAKFQAVATLHVACLSRWLQFQKREHDEWKMLLSTQINDSISRTGAAGTPHFVINKIMQVFVSFWKRSWLECEQHEKDQFFQNISLLLKQSEHTTSGTILLRNVLEEFSTKTFAEVNLSYEHHLQIKKSFQTNDLQKVFLLTYLHCSPKPTQKYEHQHLYRSSLFS